MKDKRGFTLVELLAVIVILALLIVVAVPVTTRVINETKKSAFAKYVDKLYLDVINQYQSEVSLNSKLNYTCFIYDIKKDLGLDTTKDFEGYAVVVPSIDAPNVYFSIHNKQYYIKHYKYTKEETDSEEDKKKIVEVINKYVASEYVDNVRDYAEDTLGCSKIKSNS